MLVKLCCSNIILILLIDEVYILNQPRPTHILIFILLSVNIDKCITIKERISIIYRSFWIYYPLFYKRIALSFNLYIIIKLYKLFQNLKENIANRVASRRRGVHTTDLHCPQFNMLNRGKTDPRRSTTVVRSSWRVFTPRLRAS